MQADRRGELVSCADWAPGISRSGCGLAAWGDGTAVLEAAGITADAAGVVTGDAAAKSFTDQLAAAVGLHRAWDRAPAVMASAVPPVLTS